MDKTKCPKCGNSMYNMRSDAKQCRTCRLNQQRKSAKKCTIKSRKENSKKRALEKIKSKNIDKEIANMATNKIGGSLNNPTLYLKDEEYLQFTSHLLMDYPRLYREYAMDGIDRINLKNAIKNIVEEVKKEIISDEEFLKKLKERINHLTSS
jgi:predicted ribosome quality control (RQC) complex YloA/Tae2 family protein